MSVERAIWEQWSRYKPLSDLVSADRTWKGKVPQKDEGDAKTEKPYVSLIVEDPETLRTSDNYYTTANLQMRVYAETEAQAEKIVSEAKDYFDGFAGVWSRGLIHDCKWAGTTREDDETDGSWNLLANFQVTVSERRRTAIFANVRHSGWATFTEEDWRTFTEPQWNEMT